MQGSYSASSRTMSTPHFFSSAPCLPSSPLISPSSEATPKTLHDGYSLQASLNFGAFPSPPVSFLSPPGPEVGVPPQPIRARVTRAGATRPHRYGRFTGELLFGVGMTEQQ